MSNGRNNDTRDFDAEAREIADILGGSPVPVLDKGFVRFIDKMGTDASIVQAARVSYGKGTKTPSDDQALINRLMRNDHTTPFEMCEVKFHVKLPIFVARQWIRHRTWSFNEYSCRYSDVKDDQYVPSADRVQQQSQKDKQGSGDQSESRAVQGFLNAVSSVQSLSAQAIEMGNSFGIARELNRITMTVAHYTEWYCKVDLHNLFHFLRLRLDPHAQPEIQEYARVLLAIVHELFPMATKAFLEYRMLSVKFSNNEQIVLNQIMGSVDPNEIERPTGFSDTEWREFWDKMQKIQESDPQDADAE